MPEGDTIFRLARVLDRALAGKRVLGVSSPLASISSAGLEGHQVERVESRGKNLLTFFDDRRVLYTHMKMDGTWRVLRPGAVPSPSSLRVALVVEDAVVACFDAPTVELLRERDLPRHPVLGAMGPDLASPDFDPDEAFRRLRERGEVAIGEALMDQGALAGIGNVFKSEILFSCATSPFARVDELDDARLAKLIETSRRLIRRNLGRGRRTTRFAADGPKAWVYGRSGEPCTRCGEKIAMRRQGPTARSTYYCPSCQCVPRL